MKKQNLRKKISIATFGVAAVLSLVGCGNVIHAGATNGSASVVHANAASKKAAANVAYAGSLQLTNDSYIQPAFHKLTGLSYTGYGEGADAVATLIQSGQITPNVFESIGIPPLQKVGQSKTDWAVGFASSPLVIAYSKQSPYATELTQIANGKKPLSDLFTLMAKPNFHLGRTDPNADPQGQYFVMMMHLAEKEYHLPSGTANKILGSLSNSKEVYSETDILSRLQSGQMDASSAYLPEAVEKHLPYIKLPNTLNMGSPADAKLYASQKLKLSDGSTVTGAPIEIYVTTIKGTPDQSAGVSFAKFTLSKQGLNIYRKMGYTITPFETWGKTADIPKAIAQEIKG